MGLPTTLPMKQLRIRYTGLFDYDGLYILIAEWMKARRYWFTEGSYKHKVASALGAEQEIEFNGTRRVTNYATHTIDVMMHLWDMTEVEVERNGVKKKLMNARMEITIRGALGLDFEGSFKGKFWEKVRNFFYQYVLFPEISGIYYDQLYYRMVKLHATIKDFLDMQVKGNEFANYIGDTV